MQESDRLKAFLQVKEINLNDFNTIKLRINWKRYNHDNRRPAILTILKNDLKFLILSIQNIRNCDIRIWNDANLHKLFLYILVSIEFELIFSTFKYSSIGIWFICVDLTSPPFQSDLNMFFIDGWLIHYCPIRVRVGRS